MTEPPQDHEIEPHLGALDTPPGVDPTGWNPTGSADITGEPSAPPEPGSQARRAAGRGFWSRLFGRGRR
jgi:hypothetical protein